MSGASPTHSKAIDEGGSAGAGRGRAPLVAAVTNAQVRMILDVSRLLAVPGDVDRMLCRLAEATTTLLDCERASIFLHDPANGELWTKVALKSGEIRVPCSAGIVGHAFTRNEVVHVADPYADPHFNPEPDRRTGFVTRNLLSAPVAGLDGKPIGVIQAVNKRHVPFAENDLAMIQLLAEQAGVALQRHQLQQQAMEFAALKREMDLARRTQQALVPKHPPDVAGLSCAGWTLPASTTGGDCFDLWKLPDGRLGILVADASGHGMGPALVVSQARTLVRALSEIEPDPHTLLARVNARLIQDLEGGQFVTAFLGFLSPDGLLHWSSAGHGPLSVLPPGRRGDRDPGRAGPAAGRRSTPGTATSPQPVRLEPGGSLLVATDGIFEAVNGAGEQFGIERMTARVRPPPLRPARGCAGRPARRPRGSGCGGREPLDDQTIVVVRVEKSPDRPGSE